MRATPGNQALTAEIASPDDTFSLRLLGGFEMWYAGRLILDRRWPRRKAIDVVKLLAMRPGRSMDREQFCDALWPELSAAAAAANLRKNLHHLRVALRAAGAPDIVSVAGGIVALDPRTQIDADTFESAAGAATRKKTDPVLYEAAIALYRGDLLPEDIYGEWATDDRGRLRARYLQLRVEAARLAGLRAATESALEHHRAALAIDPAHEETHRALMRIFAQSGDRVRLDQQYEACCRALREGLNATPAEETEALFEQLRGERPTRQPALPHGTFVGRGVELDRLCRAIDEAAAGRGGIAVIAGNPGIGKTRLAAEASTYAEMAGAVVLRGGCPDGDAAAAGYWPWLQCIRTFIDAVPHGALERALGAGAPAIADIVPEIRRALPDLPPAAAIESDQARFRLFDSMTTFLANAAARQPVVIVLDDVHDIDQASLSLLEFVAPELGGRRILIIATLRDGPHDSRLGRVLARVRRQYPDGQMILDGLAPPDVARLIEITAEATASRELVQSIHDRTGGNPLFVGEIVRLLISEGHGFAPGREALRLPLTPGVRDVMEQRLARLSAGCRELLRIAAVIGNEFGLDDLAGAANADRAATAALLDEAIAAHAVREAGGFGAYAFAHPLFREVTYEGLHATRRTLIHRDIAEAIENRSSGNADPVIVELAYHYHQALPAADPEKAITYLTAASRRALDRAAFEDAVRFASLAAETIDQYQPADRRRLCEALLASGRAQAHAGDTADARETFERAADLARDLRDGDLFAKAALGYDDATLSHAWVPSAQQRTLELLGEAIKHAVHGERAQRAALLARLSRALFFGGIDNARALAVAREGLALAEQSEEARVLAQALESLHWSLGAPEHSAERRSLARRMLDQALAAADSMVEFRARSLLVADLLESGDMAATTAEIDQVERLAAEMKRPFVRWCAASLGAMRAHVRGELDTAEALAIEALALGQKSETEWALPAFGAVVGGVRREQGRLAELEPAVKGFVATYPEGLTWRASLAYIYADSGHEQEARCQYEIVANNDFAGVKLDGSWLVTITVMAEVCVRLGDLSRAPVLYGLLAPYQDLHVVSGGGWEYSGSVQYYLGLLAATSGESAAAEAHLGQAIAEHERVGAPVFAAYARIELARVLIARGSENQLKIERLLADAEECGRAIAAEGIVRKVGALRAACG